MSITGSRVAVTSDTPEVSSQDSLYKEVSSQYSAALARLARAYEGQPETRSDLLQEIHLALWRSFATYDGRCSLRTWVYRIAHNVGATHIVRSRRRRAQAHLSLEEVENIEQLRDAADSEHELDVARVLERLNALIQRLAPIDRQIIVLYLEGLTAPQIAEILGISPQNAATKVHRVKHVLARNFERIRP